MGVRDEEIIVQEDFFFLCVSKVGMESDEGEVDVISIILPISS